MLNVLHCTGQVFRRQFRVLRCGDLKRVKTSSLTHQTVTTKPTGTIYKQKERMNQMMILQKLIKYTSLHH